MPTKHKVQFGGVSTAHAPPQVDDDKQLSKQEIMLQRRAELKRRAQTRQKVFEANQDLKLNREQLYSCVSRILVKHIQDAEKLISRPTEAALLFHEHNFLKHEWNIYSARGYSSTVPLFYYNFEQVAYQEIRPTQQEVISYMKFVIDRMQLMNECIVIALIYIETLMTTSKIEIRYVNWRPLLFTAILLASKFWEDISFWNVDYED